MKELKQLEVQNVTGGEALALAFDLLGYLIKKAL